MAAAAYDLYRLPFVLNGAPLFTVFPRFGELLLGADQPRWLERIDRALNPVLGKSLVVYAQKVT